MAYLPVDLMTSELRGDRRLKVSTDNYTSSFGELAIFQPTPLLQVSAQYGILDDILVANIGGTTTTEDSNFIASTGTGINNVSAIISAREAQYKPGQGLSCRLTAIFSEGKPNSTQQAGFITSESAFAFGYNGDEFGILFARDGELEIQELVITSGAGGSENASVTVDGQLVSVPITSGTPEHNAYEIAVGLSNLAPAYRYTSVNSSVFALARVPDQGAGVFDFSSSSAVASWTEIKNGTIPTEVWVKKSDWNVKPNIKINPQLGNVYQVQIQYLGYGGIAFSVEDPTTSKLEVVHVIHYASTSVTPTVPNPIFRVGWACRNTGNDTDIVVKGASAAAFVEGAVVYDGRPKALCASQTVGTTKTNVITFRNRGVFGDKANRSEIIPVIASLSSDATKTAFFELIEEPVLNAGDSLQFVRFEENSLMEYAQDSVEIVDGKVIGCFNVRSSQSVSVDINKILTSMRPGVSYCVACRITSGSASEMDLSFTWREDL